MSSPSASTATVTQSAHLVVLNKKVMKEKFRLDYAPPLFSITHVNFDIDLDYEKTVVRTTLTMHRCKGPSTDLVLDGEDLELKELHINGALVSVPDNDGKCYVNSFGNLVIAAERLPDEAEKTFEVFTSVHINPSTNLGLMGLFKTGKLLCTQCEAEGFRRITYFLDRPDVMSVYKVKLTADKTIFPVLLSNGNCVDKGDEGDRHWVQYDDPFPKPAYLFAVVAGELDSLTEVYQHPQKGGKKVTVNIWSNRSQLVKLAWSMDSIKMAMQWDDDTFGLEYDLDVFNIVCVRDFNMGAMENKSLNVFVSSLLLASPDTSTDTDYQRILSVVGHEYFHNWTGDRVTCRDWFQLTLKEGLTVFRDQQFSASMGSAAVQRIEDVVGLRARQFSEDDGPMAHPIRPESYIAMDNFYTATVYQKGAEVIRMYHTILGKEGFRKGMDLYFQRHDGHAVTCDDFRAAMADANGFDFTQFESWYLQAGTPTVTVVSTQYDAQDKKFRFVLKQEVRTNSAAKPFHIPVSVGLIGRASHKEVKATEVFHFVKSEQEFVINNVPEEPCMSVFRDFSAPIKLEYKLEFEDLAFLMAYDTDPFNRWDAGQQLFGNILKDRAEAIRDGAVKDGEFPQLQEVVIEACKRLLADSEENCKAFTGFALILPTECAIANDMRPCDPPAIHTARESLKLQIREALLTEMKSEYDKLTEQLTGKPYAILPASENTAPRMLRNVLLGYMCCDNSDESVIIAAKHHANAANMTDKIAALNCLVSRDSPEREHALDAFYRDAAGDDLVIDKWFAIQAGAQRDDVLDQIFQLREHSDFTMKTPSRMRALVTRYAINNAQFHRADGAGYLYIANAVLELDKFNGPMAARMANFLIDWKKYNVERQVMMKGELNRIMNNGDLRPETYEIVKRGLDD